VKSPRETRVCINVDVGSLIILEFNTFIYIYIIYIINNYYLIFRRVLILDAHVLIIERRIISRKIILISVSLLKGDWQMNVIGATSFIKLRLIISDW